MDKKSQKLKMLLIVCAAILIAAALFCANRSGGLSGAQVLAFMLGAILAGAGLFAYLYRRSGRKLLEKEDDIQNREQLFDILANNTNDVYLMLSTTDYTVEYVSPNIERVLGIAREAIKDNIRELTRPADQDQPGYAGIKAIEAGGSVCFERERVHRVTGEPRWFMESVYRTDVNGSERFVVVLSDRTQERRSKQVLKNALEAAKAANESKSVFLSNMSHDIRTPMNAIVGFSTLLQRDAEDPEKVREYTKKITASSQHLLSLINDVLDMSKIESGKTTLNISEISLAEIIDELASIVQPQAKAKGQQFQISVSGVSDEQVLGDGLRINQILINILSNAVKYTPEGGRIEMTVSQLAQNTKYYARYRFVVRDNGIGMSQEYLETIFQPFSREATGKTAGIQGTGLGMAITKNLVDLMGGTIQVESAVNQGTTFTLDLELRIKEQDVDPDFWKKHGVANLLVVDDEEMICTGVKDAMADTGVNVSYALGGQAAVQMTRKAEEEGRGFDLVLIDWQMPDISGIETARQIRGIVPSHVPIMILTAYDLDRIEKDGIEAGIDGFLQKPFFLGSFKNMLDELRKGEGKAGPESWAGDDILAGKSILAAEDNELNAEILLELLKMAGARCELAKNGREAAEMFERSSPDQFDIILMDVQMPVMDGYEATRVIRGCAHPRAKTVPVIAMTANAFVEDIKQALDSGMNEHVSKPVDMERLKQAVRSVLEPGTGDGQAPA